jgi:glycosyltransferase involved in cell wall biosynthesis
MMPLNPYFLIIIPVYNSEASIVNCLDSCLNQTFKDTSILCVDDGSTDNSVQIIKDIKSNNENILLFQNKSNESQLISRFKYLDKIISRYVLYLDSDDELMPDACEKLFNKLNTIDYDILEFGFKYLSSGMNYNPGNFDGADYMRLLLASYGHVQYPNAVWNKAYKYDIVRNASNKIPRFYCNMGEDKYCSIVFASLGKKRGILNESLYLYNDTNGMSTNKNRRCLDELLCVMHSAMESPQCEQADRKSVV